MGHDTHATEARAGHHAGVRQYRLHDRAECEAICCSKSASSTQFITSRRVGRVMALELTGAFQYAPGRP